MGALRHALWFRDQNILGNVFWLLILGSLYTYKWNNQARALRSVYVYIQSFGPKFLSQWTSLRCLLRRYQKRVFVRNHPYQNMIPLHMHFQFKQHEKFKKVMVFYYRAWNIKPEKGLESSIQVKNFKKTTALFSLKNIFQQYKAMKVDIIISRKC